MPEYFKPSVAHMLAINNIKPHTLKFKISVFIDLFYLENCTSLINYLKGFTGFHVTFVHFDSFSTLTSEKRVCRPSHCYLFITTRFVSILFLQKTSIVIRDNESHFIDATFRIMFTKHKDIVRILQAMLFPAWILGK